MGSIELSVIIPAYNAGKTIGRCLDSLLQSVQQAPVEIICVDDGSKDDTWNTLQSYSKKYDCLRIFHKENGGVGSARNLGLSQANGDYIAWVDSDDYVTRDWYETIHVGLAKYSPDCLVFDYFYTKNDVDKPRHINLPEKVNLDDFIYEESLERELQNFLVIRVIRAELLKKVKFNETYHMLEDYDVLTQVTPTFENIVHINKCLYHYVQNESSLTHSVSSEVLWKNIGIVKARYDYYSELGLHVSINDYFMQATAYLYDGRNNDWSQRKKRVIQLKKSLRRYWKNLFIDHDISYKLKIKLGCAIIGIEDILNILLKLKRSQC